jgi:hypothetical protein
MLTMLMLMLTLSHHLRPGLWSQHASMQAEQGTAGGETWQARDRPRKSRSGLFVVEGDQVSLAMQPQVPEV